MEIDKLKIIYGPLGMEIYHKIRDLGITGSQLLSNICGQVQAKSAKELILITNQGA